MNRNTEMHFSQVPQIHTKRSKFERSFSHKTSLNDGDWVPIFVDSDIMPGDTVQMDMAEVIRMATPIYPIMDNIYADIYFFFVPHRLVWEHWQQFWGENDDPWIQTTTYNIPQIQAPTGGWTEGTIADYMGIPTKVGGIEVNALPFRAYAKIWSDWARDENLKSCAHFYTDDTTRTGSNGGTYVTDCELGGLPAKAPKFHDYFTSCLPSAQKGQPVQIPLGTSANVLTGPDHDVNNMGMLFRYPSNNSPVNVTTNKVTNLEVEGDAFGRGNAVINPLALTNATGNEAGITISNLYTDLSTATAATISALRTAFAVQKFYEAQARGGSRYIEFVRNIFGVTSSDARMQRSEYIGGTRVPLNIDQILQTSATDTVSPQGNTAGFSCTINRDSLFTKSFEEHGTLMGIMCIRHDHTYQQGLNKMWTRKTWSDFYNPYFAYLSEMPVLVENIYATGTATTDKAAFGYQEAWAEYRYHESYVSGYMRSNATGSLDVWHLADDYNSQPYLSGTWIDEGKDEVDRVIAVSSQLTHQFIADLFFKNYYTRPMPVYSVPGLIDHV